MSPQTNVIVLGAGVIGITVAHVLTSEANEGRFKVTVVARDFPEDIDSQAQASPWAGAVWTPTVSDDDRLARWDKRTVEKWREMIPSGLARILPAKCYYNHVSDEWRKQCEEIGTDLRISSITLPEDPNVQVVVEYNTVSINPHIYLPTLKSELESRGVVFKRHRASSLDEMTKMAGEDGVVVNATSLGARSLPGVEDTKMYPVRGQSILVHAPKAQHLVIKSGGTEKPDEGLYMIPRPAPSGEALIGGTFMVNDWNLSVDWDIAHKMFERAKRLIPALSEPDVYIKNHNVGLRPWREGGPRLETEIYTWPRGGLVPRVGHVEGKKKTLVLHAYGFGGSGFHQSWGAAEDAVELLKSALTT